MEEFVRSERGSERIHGGECSSKEGPLRWRAWQTLECFALRGDVAFNAAEIFVVSAHARSVPEVGMTLTWVTAGRVATQGEQVESR